MKRLRALTSLFAVALIATSAGTALAKKCPPDSVQVGQICVDKYEESVWQVPVTNTSLIKKIQKGKATFPDLGLAGAFQVSPSSICTPAFPANFPGDGNWTPLPATDPPTPGVYAVSIAGVNPTTCITWFQAEQACLLSGKRLLINREWQGAAAGTPDPGTDNGTTDCNIITVGGPEATGVRTNCKSNWGAFDMVGNVWEWVADWADKNNVGCTDWTSQTGIAGGDFSCFGGDGSTAPVRIPGALRRGGSWGDGASAGVFAVSAYYVPGGSSNSVGFRCARNP